jgi:U3 small nucleolar RNA-associated protein 12
MCHHKSAAHATGHLTLPLLDLLFRLDWLACLQDKQANPKAKPPAPSPLLLGLAPTTYVLRVVARVRSSELEQALLLLPFTDALRLMGYLVAWLRQGSQVGAR